MKQAFITGVTGQDGAYLSQLLLEKGYDVHGMVRGSSLTEGTGARLEWLGIANDIKLVEGDLTDPSNLQRLMRKIRPDEVYNLGAQSFVKASWQQPLLTGAVTGMGAANILEAIRLECPEARFYQASSSEMYGLVQEPVQTEKTPFFPRSPYAVAKVFAHWMTVNYRESFHLHASCGILFNHESPLRGTAFVTRKITDGVARIKLGLQGRLALGNVNARRDWGHARDFVRAMWLTLQQSEPDDYVISTGRAISVLDFCRMAFECAGLRAEDYITVDNRLLRPTDIEFIVGDSSKAKQKLNWSPEISLEEMVREMVDADLRRLSRPSAMPAGKMT
jgi:GDPmannose 4,6-dehydratase